MVWLYNMFFFTCFYKGNVWIVSGMYGMFSLWSFFPMMFYSFGFVVFIYIWSQFHSTVICGFCSRHVVVRFLYVWSLVKIVSVAALCWSDHGLISRKLWSGGFDGLIFRFQPHLSGEQNTGTHGVEGFGVCIFHCLLEDGVSMLTAVSDVHIISTNMWSCGVLLWLQDFEWVPWWRLLAVLGIPRGCWQ